MLTVGQAKEKGVVFVEGDVIGYPVVNIGDLSFDVNYSSVADNWPVNSFTDRKYTGDGMPCDEDLPVIISMRSGHVQNGSNACKCRWSIEGLAGDIASWKPDLIALEKLANEKQYRKRCDEVLLSRGHEKEENPIAEKQYTFELVTDLTTNEIAKAMIDGEVFYSFNGKDKYYWENGMFVNKDGDYVSTRRSLYRKKEIEMVTRTITYPKPVSEPLNIDDVYYRVDGDKVNRFEWNNDSYDNSALKQGSIHLTEENAQAHRDALFGGKNG